MDENVWRDLAVGVGVIGIAAYFLWPKQAVAVLPSDANVQLPDTSIPSIPPYLSSNRPAYDIAPNGFDPLWGTNLSADPSLPLPDGLFRQADGSVTGGNFVGGQYVGANVPLPNPGAFNTVGLPSNPTQADGGCGC